MLKFSRALEICRHIQSVYPNFIICGSVGLIIRKLIPERSVHDLDFVSEVSGVRHLPLAFDGPDPNDWGYRIIKNDGYVCYAIVLNTIPEIDVSSTYYFNVFEFDDPSLLKYSIVDGLKVQDGEQILAYKRSYNRVKDRIDLRLI